MAKSVARNVISCRRRKLGQSLDADDGLLERLGEDVDPAEATISAGDHRTDAAAHRGIARDAWASDALLMLREQQGMAYKDIAESLHATEAQIKTWLHRARAAGGIAGRGLEKRLPLERPARGWMKSVG